eukprot:scaffold2063_cov401-Prasinococcus_capsulatus_cf.AAC.1
MMRRALSSERRGGRPRRPGRALADRLCCVSCAREASRCCWVVLGGGRRRALKCSAGTASSSPDAGAARRMQCAGGGSAGALCQVHVPA